MLLRLLGKVSVAFTPNREPSTSDRAFYLVAIVSNVPVSMQRQLARLASSSCLNLAACMPCLSAAPRSMSSLSSVLVNNLTHMQTTVPLFREDSANAQSPASQDASQPALFMGSFIHAYQPIPVRATCMPLMPAQVQASLRAAHTQQLCLVPPAPEQEGKQTVIVQQYKPSA